MPVEDEDLSAATARYGATLPDRLDLVHLGLGEDGHTASLVPDCAALGIVDRDVAISRVYEGRRRMTLTYPAIDRAREVLWVVTGEDKAEAPSPSCLPGTNRFPPRACVLRLKHC